MSVLLGNIEPFIPGGNFEAYEDRMKQFFLVNNVKEEAETPLLITIIGADIYDVLMSLTVPELPSTKTFNVLMKKLRDHFAPQRNKRAERYKFNKAIQEEGEAISEFIVRIKSLSQSCRFGDFLDLEITEQRKNVPVSSNTKDEGLTSSVITSLASMKSKVLDDVLIDRFIIGLRNIKIQQSLLNDDPISFEQCCNNALNMEMSEKASKSIQPSITHNFVNKYVSNTKSHNRQSRSKSRTPSQSELQSSASNLQTKPKLCTMERELIMRICVLPSIGNALHVIKKVIL